MGSSVADSSVVNQQRLHHSLKDTQPHFNAERLNKCEFSQKLEGEWINYCHGGIADTHHISIFVKAADE